MLSYSGLAPKTISSQEGTERRERRRDLFLAGAVLGMSGSVSWVPAAEASDGSGEALAMTSEPEGMRISGTGSVGLSVPTGACRPTGMRPEAGLGADGAADAALEAVTSLVPAGWLLAWRRRRSDME